jgi:hypothetical protein
MRSLCVRLHPIIVIVTAEPGGPPTEVSACSGGKHSVRELALPSKLKWWVGWVGWLGSRAKLRCRSMPLDRHSLPPCRKILV